jgi:hypothetical protein
MSKFFGIKIIDFEAGVMNVGRFIVWSSCQEEALEVISKYVLFTKDTLARAQYLHDDRYIVHRGPCERSRSRPFPSSGRRLHP